MLSAARRSSRHWTAFLGFGCAALAGCEAGRTVAASTNDPTVAQIVITPDSVDVTPGETAQFAAYGRTIPGDSVPITVTWSASGGSITSTGLYTAGSSVGTFSISAQTTKAVHGSAKVHVVNGHSIAASVTLSPSSVTGNVGDAAQFTATVQDAQGNVLTGKTVTWSSTNTAVVTVNATGYATAVGAGSAALVATCDGKSGQSQITVNGSTPTPAPVASVTVNPSTDTIAVGGTQTFTVTLKDAQGNVLTGRTVTWSSSAPTIARISTGGVVTGLLAGTTTITATSEGKSGTASATVAVQPPPPPPPPPSGSWAHEPSGWTSLAEHSGDVLTPSGWFVEWNDNGYLSAALDANAPMSPSGVLQYRWPTGWTNLVGMGALYHDFSPVRKAFVGLWWKPSNPWQGHVSGTNKISYLFTNGSGSIFLAMYGPPGGPYEIRVFPQFTTSLDRWLVPNVNHVNVTLGQWHKLEWLVDYSGSQGHIQWWMDGVLLGDYTDDPPPPEGLMEFKLHPVWGGAESIAKTETDDYWFDQVHVSGN